MPKQNPMTSLFQILLLRFLRSRGYADFNGLSLISNVIDSLIRDKNYPLNKRIWALSKGFYSDKLSIYDLNKENYPDYLNDFEYWRLFPLNGIYNFWIENKIVFKYVLQPFWQYTPEYYFQVYQNQIVQLMECPTGVPSTIEGILTLLQTKQSLAAKPLDGLGGEGFVKLSCIGSEYFINNKPSSKVELERLFTSWKSSTSGYVVTEYLKPHRDIAAIWGETPNTLRVAAYRLPEKCAEIPIAYVRIGTKATGVVDNTHAGGLVSLIDNETGEYKEGKQYINKRMVDCHVHPDSGTLIKGTVPYWSLITKTIVEITNYLPQLRFWGFDVAVVDDGFKILEINSFLDIHTVQCFKPVFKDEISAAFFNFMRKERGILVDDKKSRTAN